MSDFCPGGDAAIEFALLASSGLCVTSRSREAPRPEPIWHAIGTLLLITMTCVAYRTLALARRYVHGEVRYGMVS